jgi:hypothetical protein
VFIKEFVNIRTFLFTIYNLLFILIERFTKYFILAYHLKNQKTIEQNSEGDIL